MDRTLKALSLILSYPTRELQVAMPEIGAVLASDTRLTGAARRALRPLLEEMVLRMGGKPLRLDGVDRRLYHAAAVFARNARNKSQELYP